MRRLEEINRTLAGKMPELRGPFGARELGISRSCVRNELPEGSDVDLLVAIERPEDYRRGTARDRSLTAARGSGGFFRSWLIL